MKPYSVAFATLIIASMLMSPSIIAFAQMGGTGKTCEQCGMTVDATSEQHFKIVDASSNPHYAECIVCALKLLKTYGELNITTYCDYYGPNYAITVSAKGSGSIVAVNPPTALVIAGGGCTKNRIVYNQTAASALLANNGVSDYLAAIQKSLANGTLITVPISSTILTTDQAALQFGGGTPSPTPTASPAPPVYICEQCGMDIQADSQAHIKIVEASGKSLFACCIKCAIKLLNKVPSLNITTSCDWFGPNFPIKISVTNNGNNVTVDPPSALIIDGSCASNRVAYDQVAANALLANMGRSKYIVASQNTIIPSNATMMSITQAISMYGPSPVPSESPSPTETPSVTVTPTPSLVPTSQPTISPSPTGSPSLLPTSSPTLTCEVCGMEVPVDSQARYVITDGSGKIHYTECFMCALNLVKDYLTLHIMTYCDWYGPNYPITIDSTDYGNTVVVTPSTAMFLRGGSCLTARAAYNQTAADNLINDGYSQYTSLEQQYSLPSMTTVKLVNDAIKAWYLQPKPTGEPKGFSVLTLLLPVGVAVLVVVSSLLAYTRFKPRKQ